MIVREIPVELVWFKSTYSGPSGDDCVEVALFWRTSSHSGPEGDDCVEVASCPAAVHVRDSKRKDGDRFAVTPASWSAFAAFAARM